MKTKHIIIIILLILTGAIFFYFKAYYVPLPNDQLYTQEQNQIEQNSENKEITEKPTLLSVNSVTLKVGDTLIVNGKNLAGFEGDTNAWIENAAGEKGILYGDRNESNEYKIVTKLDEKICQTDNSYSGLPCEKWLELKPGKYSIYVMPWGEKSNSIQIEIK